MQVIVYSVEYYDNNDLIILTRHFDNMLSACQWRDILPKLNKSLASFTYDIYDVDNNGYMHYVKTVVLH